MSEHSIENMPAAAEPLAIPVIAADGTRYELLAVLPAGAWQCLLYWLPAMGIPARHYLPLAQALAARGIAVVLHEWRGIGSSERRAGRGSNWGYRELLQDDLPAGLVAVHQRWPQARRWLGGHSLGGQLGLLYASEHPHDFAGLLLVASGAPYWRRFRHGWLIGVAYALAPLLTGLVGYLPGRRIGFGGNEARGVITDWARSGRTGRYAAAGMARDFERQLAALQLPLLALRLQQDWLGPLASLEWLLGKLGPGERRVAVITREDMDGLPADHFGWMKTPAPVASRIADWLAAADAAFAARDGSTG
ncbi:alpha/beta fold hydrolase [Rhodanobacter sp. B2A1Ga4]|uniref:alpha/beta hydrolase family protein n=1 Tax=Rhodanobacter sp. B2A1Ga4 TaxID=2778647 RepID=UPI001B373192|nr:alpha/beta fold hydrolase [Rhodanobacter sp. B2A1Ga4]MBQ4853068.1 alpha/beta fold hydrolase [Rhodanobacter sp. B2A1Ga4]